MITLLKEEILLNKLCLPKKWLNSKKFMKKDTEVQNEITQIIEKYNKDSYSTQSEIGQIALIRSKVFEQAINFMGDTIEDMDIETEQKVKKKIFQRIK